MTRIFLGVRPASLTLNEIARESKIGSSLKIGSHHKGGCVARRRILPTPPTLSRPRSQMDGINFIVESNRRFFVDLNDSTDSTIRKSQFDRMPMSAKYNKVKKRSFQTVKLRNNELYVNMPCKKRDKNRNDIDACKSHHVGTR